MGTPGTEPTSTSAGGPAIRPTRPPAPSAPARKQSKPPETERSRNLPIGPKPRAAGQPPPGRPPPVSRRPSASAAPPPDGTGAGPFNQSVADENWRWRRRSEPGRCRPSTARHRNRTSRGQRPALAAASSSTRDHLLCIRRIVLVRSGTSGDVQRMPATGFSRPNLEPGGRLVESGSSQIDATIAARWRRSSKASASRRLERVPGTSCRINARLGATCWSSAAIRQPGRCHGVPGRGRLTRINGLVMRSGLKVALGASCRAADYRATHGGSRSRGLRRRKLFYDAVG